MTLQTEQVWKTFHHPLTQFIQRRVPDAVEAEDVLQEVFLNVHRHIGALRTQERVASWIYQIARNAITDYYRTQRPTTDLPATLADPREQVDADVDVVQRLLPCVAAVVDALPPPDREALRLTEYDGLTQQALAERLGLSLSGAKSRVQRARKRLKATLLACCHVELDHAGRIIDYQSRCDCCTGDTCQARC